MKKIIIILFLFKVNFLHSQISFKGKDELIFGVDRKIYGPIELYYSKSRLIIKKDSLFLLKEFYSRDRSISNVRKTETYGRWEVNGDTLCLLFEENLNRMIFLIRKNKIIYVPHDIHSLMQHNIKYKKSKWRRQRSRKIIWQL
jgi:hypothetical protein